MGILHAPREALEQWRVQLPAEVKPVTIRGSEYWPLSDIPGFSTKVNYANQSIEITFAAQAFAATKLTRALAVRPPVSPVLPSAFLNYDLNFATSRSRGAAGSTDVGALAELGLSNSWGVLTSTYVGRAIAGAGSGRSAARRLETTFTRDFPEHNRTLRLGDAGTRAGLWGRSLYFGGIQYGTNFGLTPGFISQPIPVLSGTSSAPSTVELYVNDVLRQVSSIPPGPFAIDNAASLSGSGEARLVVRDILGRETVIVQPFFTSAQLLQAGLNDWSAEAGSLRRDLGTASARYGPRFASGTWRHGLTDGLTLEGRAEVSRLNQVTGAGVVAALPAQVLGRAALVQSRHDLEGVGRHWLLGLERQWLKSSAQLQAQGASSGFRQLGEGSVIPIKFQLAGQVSHTTQGWGTFGLGFARIDRPGQPRLTTVSANYSVRVFEQGSLSLYLSRVLNADNGLSAGASLNIPLEKGRQVGLSTSVSGRTSNVYATAVQSPDADTDLGWRLLGGVVQDKPHAEAGTYYTGRYGRVFGDLSVAPDQSGLRAGASGGVVMAQGQVFATRRVDQSFALAEVKGYGGVGIGLGGNVLTRTDSSGIALIPQLSPYQANSIRLDPKELPINAELDSIEQIVVPAWRSAVKASFPVRSGSGALVKITLDDGEPAPAGAVVHLEGDKQQFYVARRGEAFVTGLQQTNRLTLKWKERSCTMDLALPRMAADEIQRLGPVRCQGVPR